MREMSKYKLEIRIVFILQAHISKKVWQKPKYAAIKLRKKYIQREFEKK